MKYLFMSLMFASAPAMALTAGDSYSDEVVAEYFSWCEGNSVVSQDSQGQLYVRANCSDEGLTCKTRQVYRMNRTIVSAVCIDK